MSVDPEILTRYDSFEIGFACLHAAIAIQDSDAAAGKVSDAKWARFAFLSIDLFGEVRIHFE